MTCEFDFWNHYCECTRVIARNEQSNLTFYRYNYSEDPLPEWYDQSYEYVDDDTDINENYDISMDDYVNDIDYESDIGNYTSESSDYETDIDDDWTTV